MAPSRYCFVTIAHGEDYGLLRLQARSMPLYCDPGLVHEILVVENFAPGPVVPWRHDLLCEYGPFSSRVRFVAGETLADMPPTEGWWTQQVLKLAVAQIIETDRYVALDAKNHLVAPLTREFFQTTSGKPRINGYSYRDHPLRGALERTLGYFGLDTARYIDFFPRTTTPFTFLTACVRDLMAYLSGREKATFPQAFIAKKLTEFFLYSAFLTSSGKLDAAYDLSQPVCPMVWANMATAQGCRTAVAQAEDSGTPFFSIHRLAIDAFDDVSREIVGSFWCRRRLFNSVKSAVSFLRQPNKGRPACSRGQKALRALVLRMLRFTR